MKFSKIAFDLIWCTAAICGGLAVVLADGHFRSLPAYAVQILLALAISIATFLAFFVRREPVRTDVNADVAGVAHPCVNAEPADVGSSQSSDWPFEKERSPYVEGIMYAISQSEAIHSAVVSERKTSTEHATATRRQIAIYFERHLERHAVISRATENDDLIRYFKKLTTDLQIVRRRNVLEEAVQLAKQLQDCDFDVSVSADNRITLSKHRNHSSFVNPTPSEDTIARNIAANQYVN